MIGLIRFNFQGGSAEAILGDDGCWCCAAVPCLVRPLDILYSPNGEGLVAGRRYVRKAARWLDGVILEADGSDPGVSRASNPGDSSEVLDRPCHHSRAHVTSRPNRLTHRAAARMCGVGPGMIDLWVETGAWPLPHRGKAASISFGLCDVEDWLATGTWPVGAHFHSPPEDGVSSTHPR